MLPIHGRPLLEYWLELLTNAGVKEILVNTHYLPDIVRDYVRGCHWSEYVTLVHEDALLGTGGTVLRNADWIGRSSAFIVAHADNLTRFDLAAFQRAHRERQGDCFITMMTFVTDSPQTCGIVELDGENRVCAFYEKQPDPPSQLANGAVYIFEPSVLDTLAGLPGPVIDISTQLLPLYLGRMVAWQNADYHRDIGTLESLKAAESEF